MNGPLILAFFLGLIAGASIGFIAVALFMMTDEEASP